MPLYSATSWCWLLSPFVRIHCSVELGLHAFGPVGVSSRSPHCRRERERESGTHSSCVSMTRCTIGMGVPGIL